VKCKTKQILTTLLALTILAFLVTNVSAHTITVPTNAYFGFGTGSYINFNSATTFDTAYREKGVWYFDTKGVTVQNANLTVQSWFGGYWTIFTLDAGSGIKSNLTLTNVDEPTVVYFNDVIDDRANYTYTASTKTLVLTPTNSSPVTVKLYYGTYSGGPSGSTGGVSPPPEEQPIIPPIILPLVKPVINFEYVGIFLFAVGSVLLIGMFAKARQPKTIEALWRRKVSISKKSRTSPWIPIVAYVLFILVWFLVLRRLFYG